MNNTYPKAKMMVACRDSNGSADIFVCEVEIPEQDFINDGLHYQAAISKAEEEGFTGPFLPFDAAEQRNIARQVCELECPIPFTLTDHSDSADENAPKTKGSITFGWDGISVKLNGYSDCNSLDNQGIVTFLELYEGKVIQRVYSSINREDPTHSISLEDARNECRELTFCEKLEQSILKFDATLQVENDFLLCAEEDRLNVMQATESYFNDESFDISTLTPLVGDLKPYCEQVRDLTRPYASISKSAQYELLQKAHDFYMTNGGLVVTFGAADGGFALMPLQEHAAKSVVISDLMVKLSAAGYSEEDIASVISKATNITASTVNVEGISSQIRFLLDNGYSAKEITDLVKIS